MTIYKAKFEYLGFEIFIKGRYYSGRPETLYEPAEDPEFDIFFIKIDSTDCSRLPEEEICEILEIDEYSEFRRTCCEELYGQNEHLITPDFEDDYDL